MGSQAAEGKWIKEILLRNFIKKMYAKEINPEKDITANSAVAHARYVMKIIPIRN